MRRRFRSLAVAGVVAAALLLPAAVLANPTAFFPSHIVPGEAFSVVVHVGVPVRSMDVRVVSPTGRTILAVQGFRLDLARDIHAWAACLALDSTATPGTYELKMTLDPGTRAQGSVAVTQAPLAVDEQITVSAKVFAHDTIRLDEALSDLRETPDPRKVAEARRLLAILAQNDPGAQYLFSPLQFPVHDAIETSHFGDRRIFLYSDGGSAHAIHYGIDLALPTGTPILSDGNGRVVFAGPLMVSGNTVVIEHLPGVYSLYYHMNEIDVSDGQRITAGEKIGTVGMTGLATGPHLHWEVRVHGVPVDPRSLVTGAIIDKARILTTIVDGPGTDRPPKGAATAQERG